MKFKGRTENNRPLANWKAIYQACRKHERFVVEVRELDEITLQQYGYLYGVVVPALAEHTGYSELEAETILKYRCGYKWLVKVIDGKEIITSKTNLNKKQFSSWLENIWTWMDSIGCPVPPPDPNWKEKQRCKS